MLIIDKCFWVRTQEEKQAVKGDVTMKSSTIVYRHYTNSEYNVEFK